MEECEAALSNRFGDQEVEDIVEENQDRFEDHRGKIEEETSEPFEYFNSELDGKFNLELKMTWVSIVWLSIWMS